MTLDTIHHWVRNGPRREDGTLGWFVGETLHWRTWAFGIAFIGFWWAAAPYLGTEVVIKEPVDAVLRILGIVPWLLVRPLRLLAALPATLWVVQWLRGPY